jgi:hypothetical protein
MSNELEIVGEYDFVADADAARLLLETEGIRAFLDDENFVLGTAVVAKVLVAASDVERARELLTAWDDERLARSDAPPAVDEAANEATCCLACQATIPPGQDRCPACGWTYEPQATEPV